MPSPEARGQVGQSSSVRKAILQHMLRALLLEQLNQVKINMQSERDWALKEVSTNTKTSKLWLEAHLKKAGLEIKTHTCNPQH